ncbi:MAG: cation-translocating P-type ATPase [Gemmataceae bacterium]
MIHGLTAAEVADRIAAGRVNRVRRSDRAEYLDIVGRNLFTLFNALVVPAAVLLLLLGDYRAGVSVSGMAVVNTLLGLVQEIRAKRQLDRLTLLAESRVRVVRDGAVQEVLAGDVVADDVILLAAGDAVVADGPVLEARFLEVDEALLTGESDPVPRKPGETLLSGSFCVAGEGSYRAERVGAAAFAQKTASEARQYKYTATPLQASIDRLIRVLTAIAVGLSIAYLGLFLLRGNFGVDELVRMVAATITSMVPQGLVLMATIAFLLGAVRMTAQGAIINRLAAVEAMASIDTLCMDKTGTLTTNQLRLARLEVVTTRHDEGEVRRLVSLFATCSLDTGNKSLAALRAALGETAGELVDGLPFKSQNRYSAVRVRLDGREVTLALGACEALGRFAADATESAAWHRRWRELTPTGLRLLLFAEVTAGVRERFDGSLDGFTVDPLALVALSDEMRPEATAVLRQLAEQHIRFKILSGDNPETVRATVAPLADAGGPALAALGTGPVVAGAELESAPQPERLIRDRSVFGRVSPWQKVQIVRTLRGDGARVAMLGDGVNDVLPIKNATLGIAMGDGSRATRTVAGVVLQNNDFGMLPRLLDEGRTILRNLRRAGKLFLTKNAYTLLLIVGTLGLFHLPFPFAPQQVTLLNFLTIGVPALLITLDHSRAGPARREFVRDVGWFALGTGLVVGAAALAVMLVSAWGWHDEEGMQRTMVLTTLVLLGWLTLWRTLAADRTPSLVDRMLRWLPAVGLPLYLLALYVAPVAYFFELEPLDVPRWAAVAGVSLFAAAVLAVTDRWQAAR